MGRRGLEEEARHNRRKGFYAEERRDAEVREKRGNGRIRSASQVPVLRLLSESLRLARERGSTATLDGGFAGDVEEAIESHREPLDPPAWD